MIEKGKKNDKNIDGISEKQKEETALPCASCEHEQEMGSAVFIFRLLFLSLSRKASNATNNRDSRNWQPDFTKPEKNPPYSRLLRKIIFVFSFGCF